MLNNMGNQPASASYMHIEPSRPDDRLRVRRPRTLPPPPEPVSGRLRGDRRRPRHRRPRPLRRAEPARPAGDLPRQGLLALRIEVAAVVRPDRPHETVLPIDPAVAPFLVDNTLPRLPSPSAVIAYVDTSHHDFADWRYTGEVNGKHRFVYFVGSPEQQATMQSRLTHAVVSPHPQISPPAPMTLSPAKGCAACGTLHGEFSPMLKCEVWHAVADPKDILCLDCLKTRMRQKFGRPLCIADLLPGAIGEDSELLHRIASRPRGPGRLPGQVQGGAGGLRSVQRLGRRTARERLQRLADGCFRIHDASGCTARARTSPTPPSPACWPRPSRTARCRAGHAIDRAHEIFDAAGPEAAAAFLRSTTPTEKETEDEYRQVYRHDFVALFEMYCLATALGAKPTWDELRQAKALLDTRGPEAAKAFLVACVPSPAARL